LLTVPVSATKSMPSCRSLLSTSLPIMSNNQQFIKVLEWNVNGISNKIHELFNFMTSQHIDIACLCETFLKDSSKVAGDPSFNFYRLDRHEKAKGGVAIVVSKHLKHRLLPTLQTKLIENIGVEIFLDNGSKILVYSCYLPGGTRNAELNDHLSNDLKLLHGLRQSFFHAGDFNSKHRLWNCYQANRAGTILHNEFQRFNFLIEAPPEHTHFPADPCKRPSTLDLVITNGLHELSDLMCINLCSDHVAISFKIRTNSPPAASLPRLQRDFQNADWDRYKSIIDYHTAQAAFSSEPASVSEIDRAIDNFTKLLTHARDKAVPACFNSKYRMRLPDWLLDKIKQKNVMKRRWMRNRTDELRREINLMETEIKHEIRTIRNENWNVKLSNIKPGNQAVWRTARFLKNGPRQLPPIRVEGTTIITSTEKANALADSFAQNHANPLANTHKSHSRQVNLRISTIRSTRATPTENSLPTLAEVTDAIKQLPNKKAPGSDEIKNCMMKNLPASAFRTVTNIIIACHKLAYFPIAWKAADVIPILKPSKDASIAESYRPISLLSSISKVLERTMATRLNMHCETEDIIPPFQHGFRSGMSTVNQLRKVINHARNGLAAKKSTGFIALDCEKAFDRVWRDGLVFKMDKLKFPLPLIKLVDSFLSNRTFRVTINGQRSASHRFYYGVPQGSCISPTLYSVFTSDMPSSSQHETALFADDVAKFKSSRSASTIVRGLSRAAQQTHSYMDKWRICINGRKTQAMFFSRRRSRQLPPTHMKLFNADVKLEKQIKYLGMILDNKLTLRPHINYVIDRTNVAIKILYPLLSRNSHLNAQNKLMVYKLALRPILTYGCPALKGIAKSHVARLQTTQNKILKMILNVPWFTSTTEIHSLTKIPRIEDYINKLTTNFDSKSAH
jgi:hypothetical protein